MYCLSSDGPFNIIFLEKKIVSNNKTCSEDVRELRSANLKFCKRLKICDEFLLGISGCETKMLDELIQQEDIEQ